MSTPRPPLFCWRKGRQGTGYETMMLLWSRALRMDCCVIRYPIGTCIPPHRDPVSLSDRHYRLNVTLRRAAKGGELICERSILRLGSLNFFRPDLAEHQVTMIEEGTRYVFSIGWVRRSANSN